MQHRSVAPISLLPLLSMIALVGCAATGPRLTPVAESVEPPGQLFENMGSHTRKTSIRDAEAQRYFDQGLIWAFSFNHDEAIRSFREAARLDPQAALPWWGIALCNGPHVNNAIVDEAHNAAANAAIAEAQRRRAAALPVEQALIDAVAKRYGPTAVADRRPFDEAYAAAMREVYRKFPQDADVTALYAESLMNLQPWDYWTTDDAPKGNTAEILATLEAALRLDPKHPGAHHLYIHACEAGPTPEKALASADVLRSLVPASGHMVHMPSHIDIRVGQWDQAAKMNLRAIEIDRDYRARSPKQGFYRVYMAHNPHFLSFACMMQGRSAVALHAARSLVAAIPPEFSENSPALVDPFMSAPIDVFMRFGKWDEILAEPPPAARFLYSTAFRHFARGVALAAKKDVAGAKREQADFRAATQRVPADQLVGINPARQVLAIAEEMLEGEILLGAGARNDAIERLRAAVALEDKLLYMEPPEWQHPVRHPLGAALLAAGRVSEAEQIYREDLRVWPENGWSLHGLARCLDQRGETAEAAKVRARFEKVWAQADIKIDSSCLCVPGAVQQSPPRNAGKNGKADCCVAVAAGSK
ncbi:MAG: hypothetical protein SF069_14905 [Phycisphaerae bacterium]|nr:hypothetical protein [Phycisphaerae bacterium]